MAKKFESGRHPFKLPAARRLIFGALGVAGATLASGGFGYAVKDAIDAFHTPPPPPRVGEPSRADFDTTACELPENEGGGEMQEVVVCTVTKQNMRSIVPILRAMPRTQLVQVDLSTMNRADIPSDLQRTITTALSGRGVADRVEVIFSGNLKQELPIQPAAHETNDGKWTRAAVSGAMSAGSAAGSIALFGAAFGGGRRRKGKGEEEVSGNGAIDEDALRQRVLAQIKDGVAAVALDHGTKVGVAIAAALAEENTAHTSAQHLSPTSVSFGRPSPRAPRPTHFDEDEAPTLMGQLSGDVQPVAMTVDVGQLMADISPKVAALVAPLHPADDIEAASSSLDGDVVAGVANGASNVADDEETTSPDGLGAWLQQYIAYYRQRHEEDQALRELAESGISYLYSPPAEFVPKPPSWGDLRKAAVQSVKNLFHRISTKAFAPTVGEGASIDVSSEITTAETNVRELAAAFMTEYGMVSEPELDLDRHDDATYLAELKKAMHLFPLLDDHIAKSERDNGGAAADVKGLLAGKRMVLASSGEAGIVKDAFVFRLDLQSLGRMAVGLLTIARDEAQRKREEVDVTDGGGDAPPPPAGPIDMGTTNGANAGDVDGVRGGDAWSADGPTQRDMVAALAAIVNGGGDGASFRAVAPLNVDPSIPVFLRRADPFFSHGKNHNQPTVAPMSAKWEPPKPTASIEPKGSGILSGLWGRLLRTNPGVAVPLPFPSRRSGDDLDIPAFLHRQAN